MMPTCQKCRKRSRPGPLPAPPGSSIVRKKTKTKDHNRIGPSRQMWGSWRCQILKKKEQMHCFFNALFCITDIQTDTPSRRRIIPQRLPWWTASSPCEQWDAMEVWTIFSFTRMCFPLTMTFEGVNNNILTPSCVYKQRSVVSLACVPLHCKPRPEDKRPIEVPGLLLPESSKVNNNIYRSRKRDAVNILQRKAKVEGRVCHFPAYSSREWEGN